MINAEKLSSVYATVTYQLITFSPAYKVRERAVDIFILLICNTAFEKPIYYFYLIYERRGNKKVSISGKHSGINSKFKAKI